jgi:hypothetical protein
MRLRRTGLSVVVALLASFAAILVAVATALGGDQGGIPLKYRYAGAVDNGRGAPAHYIATGEGFRFYFFDRGAQGVRSERYRLCLGRPRHPDAKCWTRAARFGLGKLTFSFTLPPSVPLGPLTARWMVDGKVVATWPFLYVRGE